MEQERIEVLRKRYWVVGEWLLLGDVEIDELQSPIKGSLISHSRRKIELP
ncbi:MAG: hypothetical protein AB1567_13720 [bacterium]